MNGIWCSVNDAGPIALLNLPLMCALSENVTLWSPSGTAINEWYGRDARLPTSGDILSLAEKSIVTIGVRDSWLHEDHRLEIRARNPNIPEFDPGFEGSERLRNLLSSNFEAPGGAKLVTTLGTYYPEADRSVAKRDELYLRTKEFWTSHHRSYVPRATIERIDAAADAKNVKHPEEYQKLAITQLLRDAWLQSELLKLFNAETAMMNTRFESITYASCHDQPTISLPSKVDNVDIDDLTRLIVDIGRASRGPIVERILALRDKPDSLAYFRRIVSEGISAYGAILNEEVARAQARRTGKIQAVLSAAGSVPAAKVGLILGVAWVILSHPNQIDFNTIRTGSIREILASLASTFSTAFGLFAFAQLAASGLAQPAIDDSTKFLQVLSLIGNDLSREELIGFVKRAL